MLYVQVVIRVLIRVLRLRGTVPHVQDVPQPLLLSLLRLALPAHCCCCCGGGRARPSSATRLGWQVVSEVAGLVGRTLRHRKKARSGAAASAVST